MIISVRAKASARSKPRVERSSSTLYDVFTNQCAEDGKANADIQRLLSEYFQVPRANVRLKSGSKNKYKIFEIV
ncbi:MAG: DUF167 domain-containing protein [Bifidobacteriaceae bacterium]|jgi:uncharacterized protein YggU (UPF0235/DUF167 family)|nr:DUF167 domain-containing protein [Bifidobacteriaceae bacterium]